MRIPTDTTEPEAPPREAGAGVSGSASVAVCLLVLASLVASAAQEKRKLPPFLDEFKSVTDPEIVARVVPIAGAQRGYLARPDTKEKLPGVLLIGADDDRQEWYRLSAREISSIGYVVLAVEDRGLDKLRGAVRWLRKRDDVFPERIGVVGWGTGGEAALRLACDDKLQACITCDGVLAEDELARLRTPTLGVFSRFDDAKAKRIDGFRAALKRAGVPGKVFSFAGVAEGFMGPPGSPKYSEREAEDAWLEIYEFLAKHVEDVGDNGTPASGGIKEIMRSVNSPTGLRGLLIRSLEKEPNSDAAWKQTRALAAMVAQGASILERMTPRRGDQKQWREQASSFRAAAERVVSQTDRRNFQGARQAVDDLGNRCAACHKQHR